MIRQKQILLLTVAFTVLVWLCQCGWKGYGEMLQGKTFSVVHNRQSIKKPDSTVPYITINHTYSFAHSSSYQTLYVQETFPLEVQSKLLFTYL